jgi:orotate phosphoribosyltransferase
MAGDEDLYYRSIDDLNRLVRDAAGKLPSDIDLVVGIPRSGLLVANLLALHMHLPLATLGGFQRGEVLDIGSRFARRPAATRKVLVVDDSVSSGRQLRAAREILKGAAVPVLYATAYCTPESLSLVDFAFEVLPQPRAFEWNILNGEVLRSSCVDLEAIVGANDDLAAPRTRQFHYPVGHIVSARPESMRAAVEAALRRGDIEWGQLWLAPASDGGDAHLAVTYRQSGASLFITRDLAGARVVAEAAQKPVLSMQAMQMIYPGRPAGAAMTFAGRRPADLNVPLSWFIRQSVADVGHRLMARRRPFRRG